MWSSCVINFKCTLKCIAWTDLYVRDVETDSTSLIPRGCDLDSTVSRAPPLLL